MPQTLPYLSWAIWLPIIAGVVVLAVARLNQGSTVKWIALLGAIAGFLVTLPLYQDFKLDTGVFQRGNFFAGASEQRHVAALQADNAVTGLRLTY